MYPALGSPYSGHLLPDACHLTLRVLRRNGIMTATESRPSRRIFYDRFVCFPSNHSPMNTRFMARPILYSLGLVLLLGSWAPAQRDASPRAAKAEDLSETTRSLVAYEEARNVEVMALFCLAVID